MQYIYIWNKADTWVPFSATLHNNNRILVNTRKQRTIAKKTLKLTHCAVGDPTLLCWLRKKLNQAIGSLSKVRHFISQHLLKTIFYSLFSSHLIYGCQVWGQNQARHWIQKNRNIARESHQNPKASQQLLYREESQTNIHIWEHHEQYVKKNKKCSYQGLLLTSSLEQDHFRSDNLPTCNMVAH